MIKKYEVETIIKDALEELDGMVSDPKDGTGRSAIFEASVEKDENGDLIFSFKEDFLKDTVDRYRIKIEYL